MKLVHPGTHKHGTHAPLKFYKIFPQAIAPEWGTEHAACFDLFACLIPGTNVTVYHKDNTKHTNTVGIQSENSGIGDNPLPVEAFLNIFEGERVMVPTGLKFDIPTGYSMRLHARSGWATKSGLVLANQEGVVDSDYVDPTYIVLTNTSSVMLTVKHGDRLAQAEMVPDMAYAIEETLDMPQPKSDRKGGFGSTGK